MFLSGPVRSDPMGSPAWSARTAGRCWPTPAVSTDTGRSTLGRSHTSAPTVTGGSSKGSTWNNISRLTGLNCSLSKTQHWTTQLSNEIQSGECKLKYFTFLPTFYIQLFYCNLLMYFCNLTHNAYLRYSRNMKWKDSYTLLVLVNFCFSHNLLLLFHKSYFSHFYVRSNL